MKPGKRKKHGKLLTELKGQRGKKSSNSKNMKRRYHTTLMKHSCMK